MPLWPFGRRHRRRRTALRPGEFPPDERQLGADLEQWLPRSGRGYRGSGPPRALADDRSNSGRSSIWTILLALVLVGALAYFAFSRAGNGTGLNIAGVATQVGNILTGGGASGTVTATPQPTTGNTATPRLTPTRPALVTSTPTPTRANVGG